MRPLEETEEVILVDAEDRRLGSAPKLDVHRDGRLHRAVSVQLCDERGRLLLQKRHVGKYHSGGLWTNTCCGHPRPGESVLDAARRRLSEEMGVSCAISWLFTTRYRAEVGSGLIEHEVVHVFGGQFSGAVRPHPSEIDGYAWVEPAALREDVARAPDRYSGWFQLYLREHWRALTSSVDVTATS
jgi:isopentenyl-diphosphate delta-isomerase